MRTLCHKILQNVSILLNADRGSLFLVQGRCNEKSGEGPKKYVSVDNIIAVIFEKKVTSDKEIFV